MICCPIYYPWLGLGPVKIWDVPRVLRWVVLEASKYRNSKPRGEESNQPKSINLRRFMIHLHISKLYSRVQSVVEQQQRRVRKKWYKYIWKWLIIIITTPKSSREEDRYNLDGACMFGRGEILLSDGVVAQRTGSRDSSTSPGVQVFKDDSQHGLVWRRCWWRKIHVSIRGWNIHHWTRND